MSKQKSLTTQELNNIMCVGSLFGFRMLGLFMVFPVLATDPQLNSLSTPIWIGLALGVYGLTQACLQIPFGLLSDVYGRKLLIFIGLLIFILGSIIAGLADNIYQLILGRALQGCGSIASVLLAYLADLTRPQVRIRAMATVGMSIGFSFLLSLIFGPILHQLIGLSGIFFVTASLGCGGLILLLMIKDDNAEVNRQGIAVEYKLSLSSVTKVLAIKQLWGFNLTVLTIHAILTMLFLFVPKLLIVDSLNLGEHWKVYLISMLASLPITFPLILLAEKKRKTRTVFFMCLLLFLVVLILFFYVQSVIFIALLLMLFFSAFNVLEALLPSAVSRVAPLQHRGTAMGVFSTHQFLGAFVGGSMGGIMLYQWGLHGLLFLSILLIILSVIVGLFVKSVQYQSHLLIIDSDQSPHQIERWTMIQPGVIEAHYQAKDSTLYLKADATQFNLQEFHVNLDKNV